MYVVEMVILQIQCHNKTVALVDGLLHGVVGFHSTCCRLCNTFFGDAIDGDGNQQYDENADYDNNAPDYDHFLNFCLQFNNEEIYTFAGIVTGDKNETEAQKKTKMNAYRVIDDNDNWGMLSAYNYTVYAPTYEAMVKAQQTMGLPTWKEVMAIVNNWESIADKYGFASQDDASKYVKEQLDKMSKFVRYHTQNSSLFADRYFKNYDPKTGQTTPEPVYSTFCSNALGIAQTLTVSG